jgi:hypothetical protein
MVNQLRGSVPLPQQLPPPPLLLLLLLLLSPPLLLAEHLPAPPCRHRAESRLMPEGVLDVVAHFGADPSGSTDSTAALQSALTAARVRNATLYLPLGCYRVRETLNATEVRAVAVSVWAGHRRGAWAGWGGAG